MTSISEKFLKSKNIVDLCKVNICIGNLFIQCNTVSCCVHKTGVVNIIFRGVCQSIGSRVSCACLSLCVIPNESTSKNHVICVIPSVNLMHCCIKHKAGSCKY